MKRWPSYDEAYQSRGAIFVKTGSFHQAIRDLTKAIELGGSNCTNYSNRAVAHAGTGRFELAINPNARVWS